ncbi:hypothetical protein KP509_33G049200 [Ceratopteris richardii]|uniref:SCP domain-containing protein n=1 Tax=Ceratopteris richardii TaxID=49495 RepID=A0A8T2QNU0_CERRI|nr:hypothetical protein KP509_33G049200 [Ceratopteris richardii]
MGTCSVAALLRFLVFFIGLLGHLICHVAAQLNAGNPYLAAHNAVRARVGVPPLVWDPSLVAYAQRYADATRASNACRLMRPSGGPFGENKFWGSPGRVWNGGDAVASWVELGKYYNAASNSCVPPSEPCGVYTQVVWHTTSSLGCASSVCPDNSTFIMCSYNPPGNVRGQSPF